jgi:hypothetical protein
LSTFSILEIGKVLQVESFGLIVFFLEYSR